MSYSQIQNTPKGPPTELLARFCETFVARHFKAANLSISGFKPYLDYKSVCRRVTNIFVLSTYPFGWLGNRQSDWFLFDWFRGARNRIRLIGPVDPDPLTNRSLPVPFKHQLQNWWSNSILLKGWDGGCVFRLR